MSDPAVPHVPLDSSEPTPGSNAGPVPHGVPLMDPARVYGEWGTQAETLVLEVLRRHVYVKGPHVSGLEKEFAADVGVRHAVAVDSCTDALFLVLRAILQDRPPEQREVVIPSFTFVATAGAVVNAGGRPVFADVSPETQNLDPASVAARVTERTAAVIPVHLFGNPVDVDVIRDAIQHRIKHGTSDGTWDRPRGSGRDVFILEDAAQAIHASVRGRRAGSLGDAGTFSFYPSKNLGAAGDGGIVTTDDDDLAHAIRALRDHGQNHKLYDHERVGTNSRMDEIQAAVLRVKMPHVSAWTRQRRAIAARYDFAFQGTPFAPQKVEADARSAYHLYTIRTKRRDELRTALQERGISTGVYYPMGLHRQSCFAPYAPDPCPVADRLAQEVISLPCFPGLTREEQDVVIDAVRGAVSS